MTVPHQTRIGAIAESLCLWPGKGRYFLLSPYSYTKLTNCLRRKHKRWGKGYREFPPSFFKKAGLYQLHGTIVRVFRTPPGERGRKAR